MQDFTELAASAEDVARLSRPQREHRVERLTEQAHQILDEAVRLHITDPGLRVAATVGLFSGGNDSTVMMHLMRPKLTHAAHANTGVGVEQTRQFVRDVCADWDLPLIERAAPRDVDSYRALVLEQGFPGPGHHYKMFQRLKERALEQVHRELVLNPRRERIVFLAGRRRPESARRTNIPAHERRWARVWVSPMVNFTAPDMVTYRLMHRANDPVPVNEVSGLIHMSGECLCGAFAHEGEREEITAWFPDAFELIAELEATLAGPGYDHVPSYRKTWGWGWQKSAITKILAHARKTGADPEPLLEELRASATGALCTSCDARATGGGPVVVDTLPRSA